MNANCCKFCSTVYIMYVWRRLYHTIVTHNPFASSMANKYDYECNKSSGESPDQFRHYIKIQYNTTRYKFIDALVTL